MKVDFSELAEARRRKLEKQKQDHYTQLDEFKVKLAEKYQVKDNPKLDLLFNKAMLLSEDIFEVEELFAELVELIK